MLQYPKLILRRFLSSSPQQQPSSSRRLKTSTPRTSRGCAPTTTTTTSDRTATTPLRARFNSRDRIPQQQPNTTTTVDFIPLEWFQQSQAVQHLSVTTVCGVYVSVLLCLNIVSTLGVATVWKNGSDVYFHTASWTVTACLHAFLHLLVVHWQKGAAVWTTTTGEMNGWTVWEQLDGVPPRSSRAHTIATANTTRRTEEDDDMAYGEQDEDESDAQIRRLLTLIPLLLALAVCYIAKFEPQYCAVHVVLCVIHILPKLACMKGVRLFGINRTAGIDDE